MKLLFDDSVWIEHLRRASLDHVIKGVRGRFALAMDAVVAAELRAGCRSKRERTTVARLVRPYERAGRLLCPVQHDFERASLALSRLRERGKLLSGGKSALFDALIAAIAVRSGGLLVTLNVADFAALATVMPLRVEGFETFMRRLRDESAPRIRGTKLNPRLIRSNAPLANRERPAVIAGRDSCSGQFALAETNSLRIVAPCSSVKPGTLTMRPSQVARMMPDGE